GAISDIEAARIHQDMMDAVKLHQDGELTEAENLYRKILERVPVQPDALHLLGQIVFKRGDEQQAVTLIRRAIVVLQGRMAWILQV
ncbi:MAG: tetratricopeptide repeat protein, partial [Gammaproteobacteria bacterium]